MIPRTGSRVQTKRTTFWQFRLQRATIPDVRKSSETMRRQSYCCLAQKEWTPDGHNPKPKMTRQSEQKIALTKMIPHVCTVALRAVHPSEKLRLKTWMPPSVQMIAEIMNCPELSNPVLTGTILHGLYQLLTTWLRDDRSFVQIMKNQHQFLSPPLPQGLRCP
jgi:hypothetical protein